MALILIAIVDNTNSHSRNLALENSTPRITFTIPAIVKPSAVGNNVTNLLTNILGNSFGNYSQDLFSTDSVIPAADIFAPFPANFFALDKEFVDYHGDPTFFW